MKRSEAVALILNTVEFGCDYDDAKIAADKILTALVDAGMLPPEIRYYKDEKCSDPELSIGPSYFEEHVPQRIVLGWEDE